MNFEGAVFAAAERALARADGLKTLLLHSGANMRSTATERSYSQEIRAACILYSMAELESLVRNVLHSSNMIINSRQHTIMSVKPCLRALAGHQTFESLQSLRDHQKLWEGRALITSLDSSLDILKLPVTTRTAQPPLDGRTLTPRHFIRIYQVYGIDENWSPRVSVSMTLTKLASTRNDLAHGNIPFAEVFSQPGLTAPEIERYIDEICDLYIHFADGFYRHVDGEKYLKATAQSTQA